MNVRRTFKQIFIAACCLGLLSACQSHVNAESTVENYLEALRSGKSQQQQEFRCIKSDAPTDDLLTDVQKWEILEQEKKVDERDPDSQYIEVSARIESISIGGYSVTQTWKFTVWNSDDLWEAQKRIFDKTDRLLAESWKTINKIDRALGQTTTSRPPTTLAPPERDKITSKPYCITNIKRAERKY